MIEIIFGILILILLFAGAALVKKRKDNIRTIEEGIIEADTFKQKLKTALLESDTILLREALALSEPVLKISEEGKKALENLKKKSRLEYYTYSFDQIPQIVKILRLAYSRWEEGRISFKKFRELLLEELESFEKMEERYRILTA